MIKRIKKFLNMDSEQLKYDKELNACFAEYLDCVLNDKDNIERMRRISDRVLALREGLEK